MQMAQERLMFELYDAYDAEAQLKSIVADNLTHPENLLNETREFIERYPNFYTCYVAFPPNYYPEKGKWYCLSSYRVRDSIISSVFGDEQHDYFTREWYKGAEMSRETGYWSQPYIDEEYDEPIFTYSDDLSDEEDSLICVISLDFSVRWMRHLLEKLKPFEEAVFVLYSSNGTLLTSSENLNGEWLEAHSEKGKFSDDGQWEVSHRTLEPVGIDMVIAVPTWYIWKSLRLGILLPFGVFLLGIVVVGFLIRRLVNDQKEYARIETEKEVMAHELRIAHDIQMSILRRDFPKDKAVELYASLLPMREVGGDLYDFHCEEDALWFIIGDVSGKGVPAAMFMSATVNLFRAAGKRFYSPKQIMEEMNAVLSENNPSFTFVTAIVGCLRISSGELLYCNAGHCSPIIVNSRQQSVTSLQMEPNIPLGYDGNYQFIEQGCMLGEGDKLVLYTDGVTEARNSERQMLGMARWTEIVASREDLQQAVKQYTGQAEPTDDITLMTIRKITPVQPVTLRVPNSEDQWPVLRRAIHDFGICTGAEKKVLKKLEVAAEEAVVNILHYSQAVEIELVISHLSGQTGIRIQLIDDGIPFDPTAHETNATAVADRQIGGMGISLIRQIADELQYQRMDDKNQLTIIKHI